MMFEEHMGQHIAVWIGGISGSKVNGDSNRIEGGRHMRL